MSEGDFVDAKKVEWGAICTSSKSKHLSAPPRQKNMMPGRTMVAVR
jgi:hypothetical protein